MPYISICSSVFSSVLDNRNEKPNINVDLEYEHQLTKQEVENINTCTQNLKAIGEALHAYENRNGCVLLSEI